MGRIAVNTWILLGLLLGVLAIAFASGCSASVKRTEPDGSSTEVRINPQGYPPGVTPVTVDQLPPAERAPVAQSTIDADWWIEEVRTARKALNMAVAYRRPELLDAVILRMRDWLEKLYGYQPEPLPGEPDRPESLEDYYLKKFDELKELRE